MTTKYRISIRHPLDGKKHALATKSLGDGKPQGYDTELQAYVANVLMLGVVQGLPSFLLERRNVIVEKKTGVLKWELVPREEWEFTFGKKEQQ